VAQMTAYAAGTPCWVDISSRDFDGTKAFYEGLFGWSALTIPAPEAGGYTMFQLDGKDVAAGMPAQDEQVPTVWSTYIASDDVDETAARIRTAGGTILMEPLDVMDAGRMLFAADPTGANFGVWQAGSHVGSEIANEPGSIVWNELHTADAQRAADFYGAVFGYAFETMDMGDDQPYRMLQLDGRTVAGITPKAGALRDAPSQWLAYFAVEDTVAAIARAQKLGGGVLSGPSDTPYGRMAVLRDPAGAVFAVIEVEQPEGGGS
jgi:uncharacterized protein